MLLLLCTNEYFMSYKQFFSSKITVLLFIILLAFLTNIKYKQWRSQRDIDREKQNLSQQAANLEKKNSELTESLSYLNSNSFKERVARQELGLKKDGETVFDFSENPNAAGASTAAGTQTKQTNFKKWWDYFTSNN